MPIRFLVDGAAHDSNDHSVPTQFVHRQMIVVATGDEVRIVFEDLLAAQGVSERMAAL